MSSKTIESLPAPAISDQLRRGKLIPFLGAGASASALQTKGDKQVKSLPAGSQLAQHLADFFNFPAEGVELNLPLVASYGEIVQVGRPELKVQLRRLFCQDYQFGPLHSYLASIDTPLLILTTNYDDLIEKAFDAVGRPYDLIVHSVESKELRGAVLVKRKREPGPARFEVVKRSELDINLNKSEGGVSVIFKMHGHCDRDETPEETKNDHFVISEEDYTKYLADINEALPQAILTHMRNRAFLFLGYSLRDWNFRVLLWKLQNDAVRRGRDRARSADDDDSTGQSISYAIQRKIFQAEDEIWTVKGVRLFRAEINDVVDKLISYQAA